LDQLPIKLKNYYFKISAVPDFKKYLPRYFWILIRRPDKFGALQYLAKSRKLLAKEALGKDHTLPTAGSMKGLLNGIFLL
jgi:hypothetical protein